MAPLPEKFRYRIKEIQLQPGKSKYPISLKVFIDGEEVYKLPQIESTKVLKWSRPIICRDVTPQSILSLEITEIHMMGHKRYMSGTYYISSIQGQTEMTLAFPNIRCSAKIILLVPETSDQFPTNALRQVKVRLPPSVLQRLGKAQNVIGAILDFGNAVADVHPAAKMIFSVSTVVWDKLKEEQQLREDTQELMDGLSGFVDLAKAAKKHAKLEQLKNVIEDILMLLEDVFLYVLEREPKTGLQTILGLADQEDRDIVNGLLGRFKLLRADFDSAVAVDAHKVVHKLDSRSLRDRLNPVSKSDFNLDSGCQDGTRQGIIANIMAWIESSPDSDSKPRGMMWIYGPAGIGKSAIAASICGQLFEQDLLAASFFCKRDDPELHEPLGVINTIAYGLALRNQAYGDAVANIIENRPELCTASTMRLRYEGLIKEPLIRLGNTTIPRPLVVLIDALDECGRSDTRCNLIEHLCDLSQIAPWVRVVVTSRPDGDITRKFKELGNIHTSSRNVRDFDASEDIYAYLEKELGESARNHKWPEGRIDRLRDKASGLFIWASIAKRFILDSIGSTLPRLDIVLSDQNLHPLDALYTQIIRDAMKDDGRDNIEAFRRSIGAIVVISTRRPLSLPDLCSLLQKEVDPDELKGVVNRLGSVLQVDEKMGNAIRFYHPSFVDFVKDPSRSDNFCVRLEARNAELAGRCLETMQAELRFNICDLETSSYFNNQVHDMEERVDQRIRDPLRYSCTYWISHLSDAMKQKHLINKVEELLQEPHALYWLEVLSLLGRMDIAVTGLLQLLEWLVQNDEQDVKERVMDLYRFTLAFYDAISVSTPHLYVSALALAPETAKIAQLKKHFPKSSPVRRGGDMGWPDWLRALNHPDQVRACAISGDGRCVATGCGDGMIRLWDMRTGAQIGGQLAGHSDLVTSVGFSSDGKFVVSGSQDKTVRIWNVKTRMPVGNPFVGHSESVTSVSFSFVGNLIVSGSQDKTVRMWDVKTRVPVGDPLVGHSKAVISIAFSPNGTLIVSGSSDNTVRVWDVKARVPVGDPLVGHSGPVTSVAFSPDGNLMGSGSWDKTVRVWDVKTRMPAGDRPFVGHSGWVNSVAFSPNGKLLVSGSSDKTVQMWNIQTRMPVGDPFIGHSDSVNSVAFSPDSKLIVSGCLDKTVRMWDVETRMPVGNRPLFGHSGWVNSVAFSRDGELIASGSWDKTVRVWDVKDRMPVGEPFVGHTGWVNSVGFSPGGDLVVSGSSDNTVRVWDVNSHTPFGDPLVGHSSRVTSVAFSPGGDFIVSGSWDNTVRMWDVKSHKPSGSPFVGHSAKVNSVAFSPNGKQIISGDSAGTVRIWDAATRMPATDLFVKHLFSMTSFVFSPASSLAVSGYSDKIVQLWGVKTHTPVGDSFIGHSDPVMSVAFSPDGNFIVSGSVDKMMRMWDAETRMPVGDPFVGHSDQVTSVAFSPDGSLVVSGSSDKTVRMWDVSTHMPVGDPFVGHNSWVTSVAFSPDGNFIVSGSWDKAVRVWGVKSRITVGDLSVGYASPASGVVYPPDGNSVAPNAKDHLAGKPDTKASATRPAFAISYTFCTFRLQIGLSSRHPYCRLTRIAYVLSRHVMDG